MSSVVCHLYKIRLLRMGYRFRLSMADQNNERPSQRYVDLNPISKENFLHGGFDTLENCLLIMKNELHRLRPFGHGVGCRIQI
ncbi:hypothetical protein DV706_17375 (plasmid) [Natronorubrum bangense]|uniref:Uncharacterized protein n=1 Tax=Natronorubrum bangense TaxID=61858 RepID=A0A4D6HQK7_9EURY|nr:hypothetical protein DV706_17375 [Natronorubrum bangense]